MCDLRLALESHAAGLAARYRNEADLQEIQFALEAMRRLTDGVIAAETEQPLLGELAREDARFHIAIMSAAKNDLMKKEILRLHLINRVLTVPLAPGAVAAKKAESDIRRREVQAKHNDIFQAIAKGNALEAKREMEFHLQEMIDHNVMLLTRAESGVLARDLTPEELAYSS